MIDGKVMSEGSKDVVDAPPHDPADLTLPSLEQRVRRLEDAIAVIQDARQFEERVVERLTDRLSRNPVTAIREPGRLIDAPRATLLPPAPPPAETGPAPPYSVGWSRFLFDTITEARAIIRMFIDPRYRLGWQTRLLVFVLLGAILSSLIWIPGITVLPGLLATLVDKFVDLILAYFLFKTLSREARRYRETAPDLPSSLRL
jgi:hypothetical protein